MSHFKAVAQKAIIRAISCTAFLCAAVVAPARVSAAAESRPVISVPGFSPAEVKAYATSIDQLTLSEHLESSRPGAARSMELKNRFEKAQRSWLAGSLESARTEFRAIAELTLKADWKNTQREVLQAAYLRLAQSSESGTEKTAWLESAALYFNDLLPNASTFPPPLLEELQRIQSRLLASSPEIDLSEVFPEARFVLLDGRKITAAERRAVKIANGTHRISALSDTHAAVTEFLTAAQLKLFRSSPPSLVEGICSTAKVKTELLTDSRVEVYSGLNCAQQNRNQNLNQNLNLKPNFLANEGPIATPDFSEKSRVRADRRTLWWVIGGAVIAGAGYAVAREFNKEAKPEAVHRNGF